MARVTIAAWIGCAVAAAVASHAAAQDERTAPPRDTWLALAQAPPLAAAEPSTQPAGRTAAPAGAADNRAQAQAPLIGDEPWEVRLKVLAPVVGLRGRGGAGAGVRNVRVTYDDYLHFVDEFECIAPVNLEARCGRWGLLVDLFYIRLEDRVRLRGRQIDLKLKQTALELGGFYRLGTWPMGPRCGHSLSVDVLAGARYQRVEGNVAMQTPAVSAREWWDPFVGSRVTWNINGKLSLFARGDVGGFDLPNSSRFTWQFVGGLDYYFTRNCFAEVGFRLLDTNYRAGDFVYDIETSGPYVAFGLRF